MLFSLIVESFATLSDWLIQFILLLDRLICRFYDWLYRLWRRCCSYFKKRRDGVSLCALMLFFLPGSLLLRRGALVTANGRPLGMVEDETILYRVKADIEESVSAVTGADYTLPLVLSASEQYGADDQFLSAQDLQDVLIKSSGELDTLAVFSIDGAFAGACHTMNEAQTVLNRVMDAYTLPTDTDIGFTQLVRVDSMIAPKTCAVEPDTLYDILLPQLNVSAMRSVCYTESIPYETVTQENDQYNQTYSRTIQEGQTGEAAVTAAVMTLNGEEYDRKILRRTVIQPAVDEKIEIGTRSVGIGTGEYLVPVEDYVLTSGFKWRWGRLHGGIDLAVPEGTAVHAADNGKVILADDSDACGYGNYIILDHQNGQKTVYAHNSELLVSEGDIVDKGDTIALSGNTGNSTGPHMHFEVRVQDEQVDPLEFITLA